MIDDKLACIDWAEERLGKFWVFCFPASDWHFVYVFHGLLDMIY